MCDKRLSEIDRQLKNLVGVIAQFDTPEETRPFVEKAKELTARRKEIEEMRQQAEEENAQLEAWNDRLDVFEAWCAAFAKVAGEGRVTYELKRMALYMLQACVMVGEKGSTPPYTLAFGTRIERPSHVAPVSDCDQMDWYRVRIG